MRILSTASEFSTFSVDCNHNHHAVTPHVTLTGQLQQTPPFKLNSITFYMPEI